MILPARVALCGLLALPLPAVAGQPATEAGQQVIALSFRGARRAYPLTLFPAPRVVNDLVGSMEIAVFHDPQRGFSSAWFRTVYGEPIEFSGAASGGVADDLTTATRWDLETGVATGGNLQGQRLVPVPFTTTSWAEWAARHPATQVFQEGSP
ncbi:MAG TPA: DUF3179 domain-containing (seleno)protein [Candidatus Methanoperedens sp.]|nr:DUF3179 domain-containing (seleno)protein [Candidatus Methanoperedens sp.]